MTREAPQQQGYVLQFDGAKHSSFYTSIISKCTA